jgi:hypothetical protein
LMFNGASATVTAWSNTSITAQVPSGATSGPLVVTVGGASSDGVYFLSQPLVDNISPNPAAVDATVTISGQNFGATQGSSVVTCNGTSFPVATWSANSIVMQQGCVQTNGTPPTTVPIQITVNTVSSAMRSESRCNAGPEHDNSERSGGHSYELVDYGDCRASPRGSSCEWAN